MNTKYLQFVMFRLFQDYFGISIMDIQEIIRLVSVVPVPNAPSFLVGIINLRGRIIPVIDLKKKFKLSDEADEPEEANQRMVRIIVCDFGVALAGFMVDEVFRVISCQERELCAAPTLIEDTEHPTCVHGIVRHEETLIQLLNVQLLLSQQEKNLIIESDAFNS